MNNVSICGDQIARKLRRAILCCHQNRHYQNMKTGLKIPTEQHLKNGKFSNAIMECSQ